MNVSYLQHSNVGLRPQKTGYTNCLLRIFCYYRVKKRIISRTSCLQPLLIIFKRIKWPIRQIGLILIISFFHICCKQFFSVFFRIQNLNSAPFSDIAVRGGNVHCFQLLTGNPIGCSNEFLRYSKVFLKNCSQCFF